MKVIAVLLICLPIVLATTTCTTGCVSSVGYWRSTRFIDPVLVFPGPHKLVCPQLAARAVHPGVCGTLTPTKCIAKCTNTSYANNIRDTCLWPGWLSAVPANFPTCGISSSYDIMMFGPMEGMNRTWWRFVVQFIAYQLNVLNGACSILTDNETLQISALLTDACTQPFPDPPCLAHLTPLQCTALCAGGDSSCTLASIFTAFNFQPTAATTLCPSFQSRGCCPLCTSQPVNKFYTNLVPSPTTSGFAPLLTTATTTTTTPVDSDSDTILFARPPNWAEISIFVMVILLLLGCCVLMFGSMIMGRSVIGRGNKSLENALRDRQL